MYQEFQRTFIYFYRPLMIVVYDITGTLAYSGVITTVNEYSNLSAIDLTEKLKSGIYFITATYEQEAYKQKMIVY